MNNTNHAQISTLGVRIDVVDYDRAIEQIVSWIRKRTHTYVCFVNVYALMMYQEDKELLRYVNKAGLVAADGMPIVWTGKLYNKAVSRVYGTTLVRKLFRATHPSRLRVYFLGGQQGQSKRLVAQVRRIYPGVDIVGVHETPDRPIRPEENKIIIHEINTSNADIVLVGLGTPHQERWIMQHRKTLTPPVLIGVGSTVDFLSGDKKEAPEWIQQTGFEWVFRLILEPRRLWFRYTVVSARFIAQITRQLIGDFF